MLFDGFTSLFKNDTGTLSMGSEMDKNPSLEGC
jgi:hypothetical protein